MSRLASKKADQLLLQRSPRKANYNISAYQFRFANSQVNSQANGQGYHKAKARPTNQQRLQTS